MDTPEVTGFTPKANLGNNREGLNSKNQSSTPTDMRGYNLADKMPVNVVYGRITWSGDLNVTNQNCSVNLKCSNPDEHPGGFQDPGDVTVTVGSGSNTSPAVDFRVDVGTP